MQHIEMWRDCQPIYPKNTLSWVFTFIFKTFKVVNGIETKEELFKVIFTLTEDAVW
jgi:hypothetical protein